ncbi:MULTISPECIES: SHOCT domain-containing protein [Malaciobacter]|jgi:uncharacterized membrane protein|uniref:Membrane protein n=2 Tax=Malaciobacter TaxID=2321114 RepID=A0AB36ZT39_9BACT|nr:MULTISPECIES: SHOCT domain-containing protein [Malaciobacter]PHO09895.1 hypothetical protein CPG37_07740 [Malaciobacter canalis]PPK60255.1 putative membrane protein [Malaciobacter marinus]QEE33513.1 hypothetical protein ACAN_2057 [Malaciobacter canalis]SKB38751.1 putative membrane protein [Malaciobacter marinus]
MYAHGFMHSSYYLAVFFIFLVIFIIVFSKKRKKKQENLEKLKQRYIKGEISKEEYEDLKKSSYKK